MTVQSVVKTQWPILVVGLVFVVAFGFVIADFWRRGSLLLGIGVGVAAVLRLVLPNGRAGLLAVRGKAVDVVMLAAVSGAMIYIAWTIDPLGTR
jgi:Protein of unknown function (DUF3017)